MELSVLQLIELLNNALRNVVPTETVAVVGEVAEFKVSQNKWVWFKLKDETGEAVIDCFWTTFGMKDQLEDGMKVRVFGYAKIHPRSGKFSYNIVRAEPVGEGALKRAYELMKKKLAAEGLFAPERKRALPRFPETIGIITSPEAAAYSDFLRILGNRWGGVTVILAPVVVQGERAISEIVAAFQYFHQLQDSPHAGTVPKPDVLVLTRGGGSMEDLRAFNSEEVARAVYGSKIPVVCGVGHERDESLADFVADLRASTPSNAAELVVPDRRDVAYQVLAMQNGIEQVMLAKIEAVRVERFLRASELFRARLERRRDRVRELVTNFEKFYSLIRANGSKKIETSARLIQTMNPAEQFRRGWSLVRDKQGKVLRGADEIRLGELISVRLSRGELGATVTSKSSDKKQGSLL